MICIIDFDGTLFKNDFFLECFFTLLIFRPLYLLKICFDNKFKLLAIKIVILSSQHITYDVSFLSNQIVIKWIKENKDRFTNVYLVSATPDFFLKNILKNQQIFDDIFGSIEINLKGTEKLNFIQKKWGTNFIYIGDSKDDIPIFKVAKESYKIINNQIINVTSIYQIN